MRFLISVLSLCLLSCSDEKISSNYKEAPIICGSSKIKTTDKIIKIYDSKGEPIRGQEFDQITFEKRDLSITDQGCVIIPKGEGALFVKVYSKIKKEMINIILPEFEPGRIKKIDLLPFASVEDQFEGRPIKDIIFENICSSTEKENRTFYTKERHYPFKILAQKKFNLRGLTVSLNSHYTGSSSSPDEEFNGPLKDLIEKTHYLSLFSQKKLNLDISLKDSFQTKTSLQTHRCVIVKITDKPLLKKINHFRVFKNKIPIIDEPLSLALEIQEKIHLQSVSFQAGEKTVTFKDSLKNRFFEGTYTFPLKDIPFLNDPSGGQITFTLTLTDRIGNSSTTKIIMRKKEVYSLSKNFPSLENPSLKFSPSLKTLFFNGKKRLGLKTYDMVRFHTLTKKQIQLIDKDPPESIIKLKKNQRILKARLLDDKRIAVILGDQEGLLERFSLYYHDTSQKSWKEQKGFDLKDLKIKKNHNEKDWYETSLSLSPKGDQFSYITHNYHKIKLITLREEIKQQELQIIFHGGIFQQFFDEKGDFILFTDRNDSFGSVPVDTFDQTKGFMMRESGHNGPKPYGPLSTGDYVVPRAGHLYKMNPQKDEDANQFKLNFCIYPFKEACKKNRQLHILGHNDKTLALGFGFDSQKERPRHLLLVDYKNWAVDPKKWKDEQRFPMVFKRPLTKVSLSPDGRYILIYQKKENLVSLIDRPSKKVLKTYAHSDLVLSLHWTKKGQAMSLSQTGDIIVTNPQKEFDPIILDNIDYLTLFKGHLLFYHQDQKKILHDLKANKKISLSLGQDDPGEQLGLLKKDDFIFAMGKNQSGGPFSPFGSGHKLFIISPDFQVKTWKKTVEQFKYRKEGDEALFLLSHMNKTYSLLSFNTKTKAFASSKEFKTQESTPLEYSPFVKRDDRLSLDFIHKNESKTQAILSFTNRTKYCVPSVRAHIRGDVCHDETWHIVTLYDLKNKKVIEEKKIKSWLEVPPLTHKGDLFIKGHFKIKLKESYSKKDLQTLGWEKFYTFANDLQKVSPLLKPDHLENWKKDDESDFFNVHPLSDGVLQIKRKKTEETKTITFHKKGLLTKRLHPNGQFLFLKVEEDDGIFLKVLDLETLKVVERFFLDVDEDGAISGLTPEGDYFLNVVVKNGKKSALIYPLNFFKENPFYEHTSK